MSQPHQPRSGIKNPNKEYWACRACGWTWFRRTPDDPFEDLAECPNCHQDERADLTRDGEPVVSIKGEIKKSLYQARGHLEISKWKRIHAQQERALPFNAPPGQHVRLTMRLIDQVFMKVTALEWKVICYLIRMQDSKTGWTWPISQQTLCYHLMGRNNEKPLDRSAIKKALDNLNETWVLVWNDITKSHDQRRLLEMTASRPSRFKVNQP